jgi:hypothetical protein
VFADGGTVGAAAALILLTGPVILFAQFDEMSEVGIDWGELFDGVCMVAPFFMGFGIFQAHLYYRGIPETKEEFLAILNTVLSAFVTTIKDGDRSVLPAAADGIDALAEGLRLADTPALVPYRNYVEELRRLHVVVRGAAKHHHRLEEDLGGRAVLDNELSVMARDLKCAMKRGHSIRTSPLITGLVDYYESHDKGLL